MKHGALCLLLYQLWVVQEALCFTLSPSGALTRCGVNVNRKCNVIRASTSDQTDQKEAKEEAGFSPDQLDFTMGYLNKHHSDVLQKMAVAFTELGTAQVQKNAFSGGTYKVESATVVHLDSDSVTLEATVNIRGQKQPTTETVKFSLESDPVEAMSRQYPTLPPVQNPLQTSPVDSFVRKFNRLCLILNQPSITGKLIQLAIQINNSTVGQLPPNLYLNQVPHNRFVRNYFYEQASKAVLNAVIRCSSAQIPNRMKMTLLFPELNPSMDAYRIGTLLELARSIAITLAEQNLRVRVCVQGSMGAGIFTGVPKSLSGVMALLQRMDWQSGPGEPNEGMVGTYVNFGHIGKEHVVNRHVDADGNQIEQDDVFLVLCPQSMIGIESSIIQPLREMAQAAGDRPLILLNPDLSDKVSSQGQQSVRGRQERMDFANTFRTMFHFQCIYVSGTSYFPILGAITKMDVDHPWVAFQRRDYANDEGEIYVPVVSSEIMPDGETIMNSFES